MDPVRSPSFVMGSQATPRYLSPRLWAARSNVVAELIMDHFETQENDFVVGIETAKFSGHIKCANFSGDV
jgi:hypothetical protein